MRLGVCGMLPPDFREISDQHLAAIKALNLTGAAFHAPGEELSAITAAECHKVRDTIAAAGMDLPQFGIGFAECLFDPSPAVRDQVVGKIERGIEVARDLAAHTCLIRTGSLNPSGSYSPSPLNLTPEARALLIETLKRIAAKAESEAVTVVIETHLLTIMGSPEANRDVLQAVGSERMTVVMDYVNHFQNLHQVYNSTERLQHIFEIMNPISTVGHCKDIKLSNGLVLHIDEEIPGDGELDLVTALKLWDDAHPDGYMLLEHLPNEKYPRAAANVHRILAAAGIPVH